MYRQDGYQNQGYSQMNSEGYMHELMPTKNYYMTEDVPEQEDIDVEKLDEEQKAELWKKELKRIGVTNTWKFKDAERVMQDFKVSK